MKFYCQDCGKLYQKCSCTVYMSSYRSGRTDPPPTYQKLPKDDEEPMPRNGTEAL